MSPFPCAMQSASVGREAPHDERAEREPFGQVDQAARWWFALSVRRARGQYTTTRPRPRPRPPRLLLVLLLAIFVPVVVAVVVLLEVVGERVELREGPTACCPSMREAGMRRPWPWPRCRSRRRPSWTRLC